MDFQVTGKLQDGLTSWDVLRAALPVGTVSGAPKVFSFLPGIRKPQPSLSSMHPSNIYIIAISRFLLTYTF